MPRKRRTFSAQFKVDAVMELLTGTKTPVDICRERNITDKLLYRWKNELLERLPEVFESAPVEDDGSAQRIAELERMVGRLALENEILKNAESWQTTHRRKNDR
jgi:transposase